MQLHVCKEYMIVENVYKIDEENDDDLNNYFECIFDKDGLNLIPKKLICLRICLENYQLILII